MTRGCGASCSLLTIAAKHVRYHWWDVRSPVLFRVAVGRRRHRAGAGTTVVFARESRASGFEGRTVAQVEFDPPDQPLPIEQLRPLLPFHAGSDACGLTDVRAAIEKLYRTGRFSDISDRRRARAERSGDGAYHHAVQLLRQRSNHRRRGRAADHQGQLLRATKLELGTLFHDGELQQAAENMQERLRANGLYEATITYRVERNPDTGGDPHAFPSRLGRARAVRRRESAGRLQQTCRYRHR